MTNYSRKQTEDYIQNKIIHKNFDPTLVQKREECYAEQVKKIDAKIKSFSDKSKDPFGDYFKNYTTAKQNGATDEVAIKAAMNGTSNFVKCPYCGSCDVKKISTIKKIAKTTAFGIVGALDDVGKNV